MGWRDEQIFVICPGSQTSLAQLGLPESLAPATYRFRSRMFPAQKQGEYEAIKIRRKQKDVKRDPQQQQQQGQTQQTYPQVNGDSGAGHEEESEWEEDHISEDGAIWPIQNGRIVDWRCFYALITHIYNIVSPPFHTPIIMIAEPCWTPKELERITQFVFERFKCPAFTMMDSAMAASYAYGVPSATVVDVGYTKADVTCISDYVLHDAGRALAVPDCGGEAMTQRLVEVLKGRKGFGREVCEQLKRSPICEILAPEDEMPDSAVDDAPNPAATASTGVDGTDGRRKSLSAAGDIPRGPGPGTEVGEEKRLEDEEGVLDIASIVTGGNMSAFLEQKEKEKQEKQAARTQKKGSDSAGQGGQAGRPVRLPNSKRPKNTFAYEDYALHDAMKQAGMSNQSMTNMQNAMDTSSTSYANEPLSAIPEAKPAEEGDNPPADPNNPAAPAQSTETNNMAITNGSTYSAQVFRREVEVGSERFQAATGGILDRLADAIFRTIQACNNLGTSHNKRSDLWDSIILVGNGAKVRGFKEALLATLTQKYLVSPSSATIFTSELPSNMSTPMATGANTPLPQHSQGQQPHSGVNPLLHAATTASLQAHQQQGQGQPGAPPHLVPPGTPQQPQSQQQQGQQHHHPHVSHAQTPTTIKYAKIPEYFPEWKEHGFEEATFLGAQVAAKVLFVVDNGQSNGFLTRTEYNERGPGGIHDVLV
ncbi:actin-like ATPase domain-containing protein [Polychaeton citri CBS 116435]|uniref:Actin-like ATPase domain-containing protein n=1 Tax=Polychaeton citri CBS 116435 TaxID=1314669 RepID=A0A9P4QC68_9PEZI|nr:actin-like ATPase domain-containing protein [Polychaeton citri CBS 116435]